MACLDHAIDALDCLANVRRCVRQIGFCRAATHDKPSERLSYLMRHGGCRSIHRHETIGALTPQPSDGACQPGIKNCGFAQEHEEDGGTCDQRIASRCVPAECVTR